MQTIDEKLDLIFKPLIEAGKKHREISERLCRKIELSNGQICKAIFGESFYEARRNQK